MSQRQDESTDGDSAAKSTETPWTVLRLLEWTTDFFRAKGSESPRLDAEILLAHARECSRIELYTAFAEVPDDKQRVGFREMVRRRGEGMPVAQLVGYREFYSLKFRVNEHVLIPRPETEHLVVEALDVAKGLGGIDRPIRIADIGTGSGAIAISIAKNLKDAEVTAIDLSEDALTIARWNAEKHKVDRRVDFRQGDLYEPLGEGDTFDLICSNPPYVTEDEYDDLPDTVRLFEPKGALVSGPTGCELIGRLLADAPPRLVPNGTILIELSPMIADACAELAEQVEGLGEVRFIKDLDGHRRILSATRVG